MQPYQQNQLKSAILTYLESNIRVQKHLNDIISISSLISQPAIIIRSIFNNLCTPVQGLKWLILFHRILISQTIPKKGINQLLFSLNTKNKTDFQKILSIKLIKPYTLYLQKRCGLQNQDQNIFEDCKINLSYFIINTLWVCLSFVDILYTFGRYYVSSYAFFIDFNITLGMDLRIIYNKLVKSIQPQNKKQLLNDIQEIHQKMYIVYYNCYFHKYLKPYVPKWISTEDGTPTSSKSIKTSAQSNIHISQFSNGMSQSMIYQPKKSQMQDSRLQIIKSMERIVSLFD